jgi:hypothetical protein
MAAKKRDITVQEWWTGLTKSQRQSVVALACVELILTPVALWDLAHRPAGEVRGAKALWVLGCAVQPFGPVAYLALGRRRCPTRQT